MNEKLVKTQRKMKDEAEQLDEDLQGVSEQMSHLNEDYANRVEVL